MRLDVDYYCCVQATLQQFMSALNSSSDQSCLHGQPSCMLQQHALLKGRLHQSLSQSFADGITNKISDGREPGQPHSSQGHIPVLCKCRYQCNITIIPVNDKHGNRIKSILVHVEASASSEAPAEGKEGRELDTRRQDLLTRAPQAYLMTQGSGNCMVLRGLEGAEVIFGTLITITTLC